MAHATGVKTKIRVDTESWPPGHAEWEVALPDDPKYALPYNMAAYDIVALAIGHLGILYAEWVLDQDFDGYTEKLKNLKMAITNAN